MCLAVPMRIESIEGMSGLAEIGGVRQDVSLAILPDTRVGDYVIVHAGFAIERLDEEEALRTLEAFRELEDRMAEDADA
ncbi:MAG: HypC/HybG/HupF family hydrogenase formation chaperone [Acidobacteria bacterium]|nr:HypC/HybG/HupF family hydrogenase formation chaperone [Acidobacteriota bacterium]